MKDNDLQAGDIVSYSFSANDKRIGLVIRVHRVPAEVKFQDAVEALFGDSRHTVPYSSCVKLND